MSQEVLQISFTHSELPAIAHQFWQWAYPSRVFAFSGTLGAGKTTFIHAICDMLGVQDAVSSPTFALINEYRFRLDGREETIYHMDWYRLRDANEAVDAGMDDALNESSAICFIEWPEKAEELLPANYVDVRLETVDEWTRQLIATKV